jgi:hypothetical protein
MKRTARWRLIGAFALPVTIASLGLAGAVPAAANGAASAPVAT